MSEQVPERWTLRNNEPVDRWGQIVGNANIVAFLNSVEAIRRELFTIRAILKGRPTE